MVPMTTMFGAALLDPSLYIPELKVRRKQSVLQQLVDVAARAGVVREPAVLCATLNLRERLFGTGLGKGVAVPHARSIAVTEARLVIARSRRGMAWDAADGLPVQLVMLALSPAEAGEEAHLEFVARVAGAGRLQRNRARLLEAADFPEVAAMLAEFLS